MFLSILAPRQSPEVVIAHNSGATGLFVKWIPLPVEHFRGQPIGYKMIYYPVDLERDVKFASVIYTMNTTTLTNLTVYTMYVINISAVSSGGIGPADSAKARTGAEGMDVLKILKLQKTQNNYSNENTEDFVVCQSL